MGKARSPRRTEATSTVTEYLIVAALVAIAVLGVITVFGDQIQELFSHKPAATPTRSVSGAAPSPAPSVK